MLSVSNSPWRRWLGRAGSTSIELALVLLSFLWLLLGTIDLARYLFTVQSVVALMSEAGRVSLMDPSWAPRGVNSWSQIATIAPLLDPAQVSLDVSQGFTGVGPVYVYVTVSYPFTAFAPGLSGLNGTITESTAYTY